MDNSKSLNSVLKARGYTTLPAFHGKKSIIKDDKVQFIGDAGEVWEWLETQPLIPAPNTATLEETIQHAMAQDPEIFDDLGSVDAIADLAEQFGVECHVVRNIIKGVEACLLYTSPSPRDS